MRSVPETDESSEECCDGWQLVHMDLKSPNVLLQDKNCLVAKLADLGISKYLLEGSLLDLTMRGACATCTAWLIHHSQSRPPWESWMPPCILLVAKVAL